MLQLEAICAAGIVEWEVLEGDLAAFLRAVFYLALFELSHELGWNERMGGAQKSKCFPENR